VSSLPENAAVEIQLIVIAVSSQSEKNCFNFGSTQNSLSK